MLPIGREFATHAVTSRRQPRFVHAGRVTNPAKGAHTNVVFDALDSSVLVKLFNRSEKRNMVTADG